MAVSPNARLVAEGLLHCLSQTNSDILDRVMLIDLQIALCFDFKIQRPMPREKLQHVIQKSNTRLPLPCPAAVEIQLQLDLCLARLAIDLCRSSRRSSHCQTIPFNKPSSASICSSVPTLIRRPSLHPA